MHFEYKNIAFVLGLSETGLGAIRSLARNNIKVVGLDYRKETAFYSKYAESFLCPNPLKQPESFLQCIISLSKKYALKPVLFITSDDFVLGVSRVRDELSRYFLFNIPSAEVIESIVNKRLQYEKAKEIGVPIPSTFYPQSMEEAKEIQNRLNYPVFIKGCFSYIWKEHFDCCKGFLVENKEDLLEKFKILFEKNVYAMAQEVIQGPDTNHYKISIYISQRHEPLMVFTLRKIRQYPPRFGVGSCVESIDLPELVTVGLKYFNGIGYRGIGSAEFKLDNRDGILKLIELNPRLWQQNLLATKCGMNFPLVQYLDLTDATPLPLYEFQKNVKWINIYMDFQSFLSYYREKNITFRDWFNSFKNIKVLSDFAWDDLRPFLHEIKYGLLLFKLPLYLMRPRN